ncbi:hypothetical protein D3C73_1433190 [compost metagenome]
MVIKGDRLAALDRELSLQGRPEMLLGERRQRETAHVPATEFLGRRLPQTDVDTVNRMGRCFGSR